MKIIVYNPNTEEWHDFINSPACKVKNREEVIDKHIEEIGTEISASEYWNNRCKYKSWSKNENVAFIGEPVGVLEELINFIDNSASYCHMSESFPEDFIESRTDWSSMQDYADEMSSFIIGLVETYLAEQKK